MNHYEQARLILALLGWIFGDHKEWHQSIMQVKPDDLISKAFAEIETLPAGLFESTLEILEQYAEKHGLSKS